MIGDLAMDSGAILSPCGKYRYKLWRRWDESLPPAVYIMLNPSTADAFTDDPTITRCIARAMNHLPVRAGGIVVVNLFAYRETDSSLLPQLHRAGVDLLGPDNDYWLMDAVKGAAITICAWGKCGVLGERAGIVRSKLRQAGHVVHALRIGKNGQPEHPLYIGYDVKPEVFI